MHDDGGAFPETCAGAAIWYLRRGMSVIPIAPRGKRAVVEWKNFQARRATEEQARAWWKENPDANVGIVTGAISGIVVIDVDGPEGEDALRAHAGEFPATPTALTAKGSHLVLAHPRVPVKTRAGILPKVDVRADGGYIVAPPSEHSSGRIYGWSRESGRGFDAPPAAIPPSVLELLIQPAHKTAVAAGAPEARPLSPRVTAEEMERAIPEGQRNQTLTRFAGSLYASGYDEGAVLGELLAINMTRCTPPLDEREVHAIAASVARRDARRRHNGAPRTEPRLLTRQLETVVAEEMRWLWPQYIPLGGVTIWDGAAGVGKSTATLDLAARVTTGRAMPDGSPGVLGHVLLLNVEDSVARTIVPRLEAAAADRSMITLIEGVEIGDGRNRQPSLPEDLPLVRGIATQRGVRLIIVDPLMAFLSTRINSWSDQQVRIALSPLAKLAEELDLAVLVVRHPTKNREAGPMEAGSGSYGIIGASRAAFLIGHHPENEGEVVIAPVKQNLSAGVPSLTFRLEAADHGAPRVRWLGPTDVDAFALRPPRVEQATKLEEAKAFLEEFLAAGEQPEHEVTSRARLRGISDTTLTRAKRRLGVVSRKAGFGNGGQWSWSLRLAEGSHGETRANTEAMTSFEADTPPYQSEGEGNTKKVISSIPPLPLGTGICRATAEEAPPGTENAAPEITSTEESRECSEFDERAAIMQYDGGFSQDEAERRARGELA